jgi:hypothetical protein
MLKTPLIWKAEPGSAFSAQLGNLITYHAITQTDGYPAYVEIRGQRGGVKRFNLGLYRTMEHALQACERQRRATLYSESSISPHPAAAPSPAHSTGRPARNRRPGAPERRELAPSGRVHRN